MDKPTVHILYKFSDGPWGGGNQFLKALKKQFCRMAVYEEDARRADIILFNSFPFRNEHFFSFIYDLKRKYRKTIVHRMDGPIQLVRGRDSSIDAVLFYFNRAFCDGTIFQSCWSRSENRRLGMRENASEQVILNAPDPDLFFPGGNSLQKMKSTVRLIATSWSANMNKGFRLYDFLDKNLDFSHYEMSFYGNSPLSFANIKQFNPLPSHELAERLRRSDLFITASVNDPCSNSLLEALHCGLPAVAINSGGNPEIVNEGGMTFEGERDVLTTIDGASENIDQLRSRIRLPSLVQVSEMYYEFCRQVHGRAQDAGKRVGYFRFLRLKSLLHKHQGNAKKQIDR